MAEKGSKRQQEWNCDDMIRLGDDGSVSIKCRHRGHINWVDRNSCAPNGDTLVKLAGVAPQSKIAMGYMVLFQPSPPLQQERRDEKFKMTD